MHLGMYMHKGQAKQIFYMVDTDRSGHISEREFCMFIFISYLLILKLINSPR